MSALKLEAATRVQAAEAAGLDPGMDHGENGHWFYNMSKEHQDAYIAEHPDSKYAKERKAMQPKKKPIQNKEQNPVAKKPAAPKSKPNAKAKPKAKPKPKKRSAASSAVRSVIGEGANLVNGAGAAMRMLTGKGGKGDGLAVAKAVGAVLATGGVAAAIGASAPAAFLGYVALKHLTPVALTKLMKWSHDAIRNRSWEYDDETDTWHRRDDAEHNPLAASADYVNEDGDDLDQLLHVMDLAVASGKIPKEAMEKAQAEDPIHHASQTPKNPVYNSWPRYEDI